MPWSRPSLTFTCGVAAVALMGCAGPATTPAATMSEPVVTPTISATPTAAVTSTTLIFTMTPTPTPTFVTASAAAPSPRPTATPAKTASPTPTVTRTSPATTPSAVPTKKTTPSSTKEGQATGACTLPTFEQMKKQFSTSYQPYTKLLTQTCSKTDPSWSLARIAYDQVNDYPGGHTKHIDGWIIVQWVGGELKMQREMASRHGTVCYKDPDGDRYPADLIAQMQKEYGC